LLKHLINILKKMLFQGNKNKKAQYKDKPPFVINEMIEKKFKDEYKDCLQKIFVNLAKNIIKIK